MLELCLIIKKPSLDFAESLVVLLSPDGFLKSISDSCQIWRNSPSAYFYPLEVACPGTAGSTTLLPFLSQRSLQDCLTVLGREASQLHLTYVHQSHQSWLVRTLCPQVQDRVTVLLPLTSFPAFRGLQVMLFAKSADFIGNFVKQNKKVYFSCNLRCYFPLLIQTSLGWYWRDMVHDDASGSFWQRDFIKTLIK